LSKLVSRRTVLKAFVAAAGGLGVKALTRCAAGAGRPSEELRGWACLPSIGCRETSPTPVRKATKSGPPFGSTVVHIRSQGATTWDFGDRYYGDFVDQDVVNEMVDEGVTALTETAAAPEAWRALVPDYSPGKAIAIKVNFNNSWVCQPTHVNLNNVIHPINSIVRGLKLAYQSFDESDVWIYEACRSWQTREVSDRFVAGCLYPGVRFFDYSCHEHAGYENDDPTALITWNNPPGIAGPPETRLTDALVNATYLINMPIIKRHWAAGITLAMKNHLGSIANAWALHDWVYPTGGEYGGTLYNPIVDLSLNPHIADKTVLILADALYGNWRCNNSKAEPWASFGGSAPDSLLLATDVVAVDCVMCDLLDAEQQVGAFADDYLVYASTVGLGTYERGDPWGDGYDQIVYEYVAV